MIILLSVTLLFLYLILRELRDIYDVLNGLDKPFLYTPDEPWTDKPAKKIKK